MASITITVKNTSGARFEMSISALSETIADFKTRLADVSGIPANAQRLIFRGHILKDHLTFEDIKSKHGLESGQSMHVVSAPSAARQSTNTAPAATPAAAAPTTAPSLAASNPSGATPVTGSSPTPPSTTPFNLFGGAGAGVGGATGGFPGAGGFPDMQELQNQLMRNPEQMQAMLNSPLMDSIMNNPDIARSFLMANPQMRELVERNPEVGHILNDPATFRQMMQMARNPSLMNEMMRSSDRQMANIEATPGGFDALRRMHENIQAPLMDAAQAGFAPDTAQTQQNGTDDNPFSSLFQQNNTPSNAPMPNPWAPNGGTSATTGTTPEANPSGAGTSPLANPFGSLFPGAQGGTAPGNPPAGSAQVPPFPPMGNMFQGLDNNAMMQMLDSPQVQQMMQSILGQPELLRSVVESNPALNSMMQSNPELARLLQNPELMRTFLNPEVMRAARQLQEAMGNVNVDGRVPGPGTTPAQPSPAPPAAAGGAQNGAQTTPSATPTDFAEMMTRFANQMQNPNANPTANGPTTGAAAQVGGNLTDRSREWIDDLLQNLPPGGAPLGNRGPEPTQEQLAEMYSSQLAQLRDMGFLDETMCLQALRQSQGNVSAAIENLLSRFGG